MTFLRIVSAALLVPTLIACSDASGKTSGGEPTLDGSTPPLPTPDGGDAAALPPSCGKDGGANFADLYRDCFGPTAAHCGQSQCHGSSTSAGGGIWVCGDTEDSCFTGMTTANPTIIESGDPTKTTLYSALRTQQNSGASFMPRNSTFTFAPEDLKRISDWISAGVPRR